MNDAELHKILEEGDDQQCAAFFRGASEAQRRALAPLCLKWYRQVSRDDFIETKPGTFSRNPRLPVAATAVFATASYAELKKLGWQARPDGDLVYEMLLDRRPDWLEKWVTELLEEDYYWNHWSLIRRLMAEELIERPDHPNYIPAMISGIVGAGGRFKDEITVEQALRDDPSLLEDEVWQLFECEGAGENSLANWDRFSRGGTWTDALVALVKSGDLPRDRLLERSLDALDLDFNHYRAKWFSSFHDALQPTPQEQREFAERYLRLLGVSAPNIVSWAFKKVEGLCKGKQAGAVFDAALLVDGLKPVLEARTKGIVKKALKLLSAIAKRSPEAASAVAAAALTALSHEDAEVQSAALDVIDAYGDVADQGFAERLAACAEFIAPSERSRLARWLEASGTKATVPQAGSDLGVEVTFDPKQLDGIDPKIMKIYGINGLVDNLQHAELEIPAATFDGTEIPRLIPDQRLVPINDLDELIDVCARVIEDDTLIDDAERAIDGISRLCAEKPADFEMRVGPLLKRVTQGLKKNRACFLALGAGDDLCGLVYAWCTGIVLAPKNEKNGRHRSATFTIDGETRGYFTANREKGLGFLTQRVLAIARRVAGGNAGPLLSAPTHEGGWIDPLEFAKRVDAVADSIPDETDLCQALLRLAPEGRGEALAQLPDLTTEWGSAVRYALGEDGITMGETAALWIAASRCRAPWSDDELVQKAFPNHDPDAGHAASYAFKCRTRDLGHTDLFVTSTPKPGKAHDINCVTVTFHQQQNASEGLRWELGGCGGRTVGSIRWTATIWPQARDSFFGLAAMDLADNLDWWEAQWQNKALLEPLLDPGTPLRELGLLVLAVSLAAKDPGEYGLATDIAIRAIEDGRLGSDNLGSMLGRLLPTGLIKPARWEKRLAEVARVSTLHAAVVQRALQRCFAPDMGDLPRDFAKLLDVLKELSIELGQHISHEPCRAHLTDVKGSGKAAKTAKALLALAAGEPEKTKMILQLALQQRVQTLPASGLVRGAGR